MEEITVLGPIEAWRFWRVGFHRQGNPEELVPKLHSYIYAGYCWEPGKPADSSWGHIEICINFSHYMREWESTRLGARTALFSCECGIYGWKDLAQAKGKADTYRNTVLGKVALWGRGIKGEYGYRAEYGYPVLLAGAVCSQCGNLVSFDGIAVVGDRANPVIDNPTILNYRLVCKDHILDDKVEEKLPQGWYHDLLHEYSIALENVA